MITSLFLALFGLTTSQAQPLNTGEAILFSGLCWVQETGEERRLASESILVHSNLEEGRGLRAWILVRGEVNLARCQAPDLEKDKINLEVGHFRYEDDLDRPGFNLR